MSDTDNPYNTGYGTGYGGQGGAKVTYGTGNSANAPGGRPGAAPSGPGQQHTGPLISETTTADFPRDVIEASRSQPVLVDFWAPWCGPCRQLTPILEKVVTEAGGKVKLVKMNIDDHPAIPGQMGIQSIPAVLAFVDGQPVDGFMGAVPESQIREFITKVASQGSGPDPVVEALEQAQEAVAKGDISTAAQIYAGILQQDQTNADALGGMAGIYFDNGDADKARALLEMVPEDKADNPAVAAVRARMELAAEAASLGDRAPLLSRLEADGNDHEARLDLAKIENAAGNREVAADLLLEIIRRDKKWNDGAAKEQLLQFFEAWGMDDPDTILARRRLSALLFS